MAYAGSCISLEPTRYPVVWLWAIEDNNKLYICNSIIIKYFNINKHTTDRTIKRLFWNVPSCFLKPRFGE